MGQRIAIISALHEELAEVLDLMPDEHKTTIAGRQFWRGHLHGHEVVSVLSGIGKVAAATTATVLLEHFKPQQVIFTGVAGGLATGVEVGDIVVGNAFAQHDMDASPLFPRHELPGYSRSRFAGDMALTQVLQEAAKDAVTWLPKLLDDQTLRGFGLHSPVCTRAKSSRVTALYRPRPKARRCVPSCLRLWLWTWRAPPWHRCALITAYPLALCEPCQTAPTTRRMWISSTFCSRWPAITAGALCAKP